MGHVHSLRGRLAGRRLIVGACLAACSLGLALSACGRGQSAMPTPAGAAPAPDVAVAVSRGAPGLAERRDLASLPYLGAAPVPPGQEGRRGVTRWQRGRASPGVTVLCSERTRELKFLDLDGSVLHRIEIPTAQCLFSRGLGPDFLVMAHGALYRVTWEGAVLWAIEGDGLHHDFAVSADGAAIHVLSAAVSEIEGARGPLRVLDNRISTYGADGTLREHRSLLPGLRPLIPDEALARLADAQDAQPELAVDWNNPTDLLHCNALVRLAAPLGRQGIGAGGDFLLSCRHLDALVLLDQRTLRVRWSFGPGLLEGPHAPVPVRPHGTYLGQPAHLLVFDNGARRGWSRLLELEPRDRPPGARLGWRYQPGAAALFSASRGSAQRLVNGNHLVTESERGRVFELAPDGEIVWEYWNPDFKAPEAPSAPPERRMIYRAYRFTPHDLASPAFRELWLREFGAVPLRARSQRGARASR